VIRTKVRDGMMNYLKSAGIGTGLHYPVPLHLQKAYASLKYSQGDFPVAESAASEIISLPMFPQAYGPTASQGGRGDSPLPFQELLRANQSCERVTGVSCTARMKNTT